MRETPSISGSTYTSAAVNMMAASGGLGGAGALWGGAGGGNLAQWVGDSTAGNTDYGHELHREQARRFMAAAQNQKLQEIPTNLNKEKPPMPTLRRLVQVFISDSDENVPLADSLLYSGDQKLTDATDQELFFEIDIKGIIETHNAKRTKLVNKKVKERTEYLEPAKIRDLKMVVVTVAQF